MPTMKRFEEKSVLITGASRGIGKGIAKRFADEGANLVLASNEEAIHQVAKEFKASGVNAISLVCDVTQKSEVECLYDRASLTPHPVKRDRDSFTLPTTQRANLVSSELLKAWPKS
jgi:NAD(P)-dependent dehydrogenase (short-subunit alcohol dehydrogenase family)